MTLIQTIVNLNFALIHFITLVNIRSCDFQQSQRYKMVDG